MYSNINYQRFHAANIPNVVLVTLFRCWLLQLPFDDGVTIACTSHYARLLPKWEWNLEIDQCGWSSQFLCDNQLKSYADLSQCNWERIVTFLVSLKWKRVDTALTAYVELAYAFWHAGFKLDDLPEPPEAYSKCIRKCVNQALKNSPEMPIVPGVQVAKCKSLGRTLPAGCIFGAIPCLDKRALQLLAFRVLHGRSQYLRDWGVPF